MPYDPYQNPDNKPYVGNFNWVPTPREGLGGSVPGPSYRNLVLERGEFRNDAPVIGNSGNAVIEEPGGEVESAEGSEMYPITRAYRYVEDPYGYTGTIPTEPFIAHGEELSWAVQLPNNVDRVSGMTIEYRLTVDILDESIDLYLDESDLELVQAYRADPENNPYPDIEFPKYPWGMVRASLDVDGDGDEFPKPVNDVPSELMLTGFQGKSQPIRILHIKFKTGDGDEDMPESYSVQKRIRISNRYSIPTLRIEIHKIQLFNAERVNISYGQTPTALLQYAYLVDFEFDPIRGTALWPNSSSEPNFHCKIFAPDENVAETGLAHSVYLKFLIFAIPAYGIAPGDFSLIGLLEDMANPSAFFCMFVGPRPGRRNAFYSLMARTNLTPAGRVVPLDLFPVRDNCIEIVVEKYTGSVSASPPTTSSQYSTVYTYVLDTNNTYSDGGPMISPYLYLDKTENDNVAKSTDWFRVRQHLLSDVEFVSTPFRSQVWSEKTSFQALTEPSISNSEPREYATRRVEMLSNLPNGPFSAPAVATFVVDDEKVFTNPIQIAPGAWRFKIRAQALDDQITADMHLMARWWLVPANIPSTATPEEIAAYRDTTEIYFDSVTGTDGSEKSTLKIGKPTNLRHVMITPPLDSTLREYEVVRYIEQAEDGGTTLDIPGGDWKLAVGLYVLSEPTGDGSTTTPSLTAKTCPRVQVEFDPTYGYAEGTCLMSQSHALFPIRWLRYNSSRYQPYGGVADPYSPLSIRETRFYGSDANDDEFIVYDDTVRPYDPSSSTTAYYNLYTLRGGEEDSVGFCIPYTVIPNTHTAEGQVKADFCASAENIAGGRISNVRATGASTEAGTWKVEWSVDEGIDNESIKLDMRVEGFVVDVSGRITERIFRSPLVPFVTGQANYEYETEITVPFVLTSSADSRLVLRFYAYPYSANGSPVKIDDIQALMGDKPVGMRITRAAIMKHTLETLQINQTPSFIGSPAFYENLDLVPSRSIGGNEFWYIADEENLKFKVIIRPDTFRIQGTMYSPVWYLNMPKDVEVIVRAPSLNSGIFSRQLWVRTVPGEDGTTTQRLSVSAVGHPISERVHVVFNERGEVEEDERGVEVLTHQAGRSQPQYVDVVKDKDDNKLKGTEASVFRTSLSGGDKSGSVVGVSTQFADSEIATVNVGASTKHAHAGTFRTANAALNSSTLNQPRYIAAGLKLHSTATSHNGDKCYVVGWVDGGGLVLRTATLTQSQQQGPGGIGDVFLIDGSPESSMPYEQTPRPPKGGISGTVSEDYAAVFVDSRDRPTAIYSVVGRDGELIGRTLDETGFGRAFVVCSFRQGGISNSSETPMVSPAATFNEHYDEGTVVFWSSGRLFATQIPRQNSSGQTVLKPIHLIAGSSDFTSGSTADNTFTQMQSAGYLIVNRADNEDNVLQQRAGIVSLRTVQYYGQTAIYYVAANGDLVCRHLSQSGSVGKAFKLTEIN